MIARLFIVALSIVATSARGETQKPAIPTTSDGDSHYSASAYKKGHDDAERDAKSGRLALEIYGLPEPYFGEYTKLLLNRYHIELRQVAGCVIDDEVAGHAKGYNEIAMKEIQRRYGKNMLEDGRSEASKQFEASRQR